MQIRGTFDVKIAPAQTYATGIDGIGLGRLTLDKVFYGDLTATSKGEMLSARTQTEGSAGYVAIEQVTGTLLGKTGSFVLQHFGTMDHGKERLILEVVPDSAAGELDGLRGSMKILFEGEKHFYEFDFSLAESS